MVKKERLFLVDGTALAYRSHFAMARAGLTDPSGRPTGAVYGFLSAILRLIDAEQPDHMAIAFDPPGATFRHEQYPEYKATRERMPEELVAQLPALREVAEGLRIPFLEVGGYEADDVIGTLVHQAEHSGLEVFIVTADKDFMQLVSDDVKLYNILKPGQDLEIVGTDEVRAKFGVPPDQVIEVLGLMGDTSDNIKGVPGVGQKTAAKLIGEYGSIANLLEHTAEIKAKKLRENLEEAAGYLALSRELVTICTEVPLAVKPEELVLGEPDRARMITLCRELEFTTLLKRFSTGLEEEAAEVTYTIIRQPEELQALVEKLRGAGEFTFDTETTSIDAHRARVVGLSFAVQEREAYYVPLNLVPPILEDGPEAVLAQLKPLFEDPSLSKNGQNIKYDATVLAHAGIEVRNIAFDTMIADYCVAPGGRSHGLDAMALKYLDFRKIETEELIGKGKDQTTMDLVPVEEVGRYACEDADITHRLRVLLDGELQKEGQEDLFHEIEMPLVPVLMRMEMHGVALDVPRLEKLGRDMATNSRRLAREIYELAGEQFNLNSPKQLGPILFEKLRIHDEFGKKKVKRTKTGYATDARTLEAFGAVPIVSRLLEYRSITKLMGTYVEALPRLVNPRTGRLHTSFNQSVAATGRLSSSDPNLQNIPIRSPLGREIRKAFVPAPRGWKMLSADYSQIELRLVAHLSLDERLMEAFEQGADIHNQTAALIFGVSMDDIDPGMRSKAKAINFGIIYGMGPQRLAAETKISLGEAKAFIEAYFQTFPGVRAYLDRTLERARETGFVETLFGRRRRIPDITSSRPGLRVAAENIAVNTPVQGSAADLIKKAMLEVDRRLREASLESRMLLQVHDELVFECPEAEVDPLRAILIDAMEGVMELRVPLEIDMGVGANWLEAH